VFPLNSIDHVQSVDVVWRQHGRARRHKRLEDPDLAALFVAVTLEPLLDLERNERRGQDCDDGEPLSKRHGGDPEGENEA